MHIPSKSPNPSPNPSLDPNLDQGTKNDDKKLLMQLTSPYAYEQLSAVLTFGAKKYAERNWEKGINFSRIIGSIERHLIEIKKSKDIDLETELLHSAHLMCNAMFLCHYQLFDYYKQFDDRPSKLSPK